MKKVFISTFIVLLLLTTINIIQLNNNRLDQPYVFDIPQFIFDKYYESRNISIPYLTNQHDTHYITHAMIDDYYIYPFFNPFHFEVSPSNQQLSAKYYYYNLNFATLTIDSHTYQSLIEKNKEQFEIQLFFDNGSIITKPILITFLNEHIDFIGGTTSSNLSNEIHSSLTFLKDVEIQQIHFINHTFNGTVKIHSEEKTLSSLPWRIPSGQSIKFHSTNNDPTTPQNSEIFSYIGVEGIVKETNEKFIQYQPYPSWYPYKDNYFINYLKEHN